MSNLNPSAVITEVCACSFSSLFSMPFPAPKHRTSCLSLDWVTCREKQMSGEAHRGKASPSFTTVSRTEPGSQSFPTTREEVAPELARPAERFKAMSHLLAASQGALTAPLFGEGTLRQDWRERWMGNRDETRQRDLRMEAEWKRSHRDPKGGRQTQTEKDQDNRRLEHPAER